MIPVCVFVPRDTSNEQVLLCMISEKSYIGSHWWGALSNRLVNACSFIVVTHRGSFMFIKLGGFQAQRHLTTTASENIAKAISESLDPIILCIIWWVKLRKSDDHAFITCPQHSFWNQDYFILRTLSWNQGSLLLCTHAIRSCLEREYSTFVTGSRHLDKAMYNLSPSLTTIVCSVSKIRGFLCTHDARKTLLRTRASDSEQCRVEPSKLK